MILVTGASGLLGANLLREGLRLGRRMAAVVNKHRIRLHDVECWSIDLTDVQGTARLVRQARPEVIIHCAAQTSLDAAEKDPEAAQAINVGSTLKLAEIAAETGAQFVYISTDAVFDGTRSWNRESDPVNPLSVYGRTKYDGELAALRANPGALIARVNIYGWNAQPKDSLAEWMLHKLEAGETIPGFTDVYFCPMLVNDLAGILFAMLDHELRGVYHICGSERISKYEFGVRIARQFGFDERQVLRASVHDSPLLARRALDLSMSTDKITAAIGDRMPSVEAGLKRFANLRESGFVAELKSMIEETA